MHASVVLAALLQAVPPDVSAPEAAGGSGLSAFLGTLVVGALLVAFAPGFLERKVAAVEADPLGSFAYGVVALLALVLAFVLLAVTLIGIPLALLLAAFTWLVWVVGATIGYLAIADRLLDHDEGWLVPLLVAAAFNGAVTITGIGWLVSFLVGATGVGAVLGSQSEASTATTATDARARR